MIVIKGDLGCVLIDTLESTQGAQVCIEALKKAQVIGTFFQRFEIVPLVFMQVNIQLIAHRSSKQVMMVRNANHI